MGNYRNIETDFIERTLELISQYESVLHTYEFERQFNHTLIINCLLGLIVFPKERAISYLPKEILDNNLKQKMGVVNSQFNSDLKDLRSLIISLRHSIAHFDIHFESDNEEFLIDRILFKDKDEGDDYIIATFIPSELLSFIRYYGGWFVSIVRKYKKEIYAET
jgi:hypothetical protein